MHQVFRLSNAGRGDTAIYVPEDNYILDYKGRTCLLIAGKFNDGEQFDQYAVGIYAIEGKAGTYLDAIDGDLSGNSVEHGGVDSVIRFKKQLPANSTVSLDYWSNCRQQPKRPRAYT
jgi:GH15 family glucan-1,4-alpha-glucosidase